MKAKYWIQSENTRHSARQKQLRSAMSIQKRFEKKKSRESQLSLSTFSACNFHLENFDFYDQKNRISKKKSFWVLLGKLSYCDEFL